MKEGPNIMKTAPSGFARGAGMMVAGFVSMVAGLCLGSFLADARSDRSHVEGARKAVLLHVAQVGPEPVRRAAMAVMADGVMTVKEERHLYTVIDQVRRTADAEPKERPLGNVDQMPYANRRRPAETI